MGGEEGVVGVGFGSRKDPVKDVPNNSEEVLLRGAVKFAPDVAFVGSGADGKALEPKELGEPGGVGGRRVCCCDEGGVGTGAASGVAAGHMGVEVAGLKKEGLGGVAQAASVKANAGKLVVRDEVEAVVFVGRA